MSRIDRVRLADLPPPSIIEELDFESIYDRKRRVLLQLHPEVAPVLELESEPLVKLLQVSAYDEMLIRNRVNEGLRALLLAFARGPDLEHKAADFGLARQIVNPGDPDAVPPVPAVIEGDDALRDRRELALEALAAAGPRGAYIAHALAASGSVRDASVVNAEDALPGGPSLGQVLVTVLRREDGDLTLAETLDAVERALDHEIVRPCSDTVLVAAADVIDYDVEAEITISDEPGAGLAHEEAIAAVRAYTNARYRLGHSVRRSGVEGRLHRAGVERVDLIQPVADIEVDPRQAARAGTITVRRV